MAKRASLAPTSSPTERTPPAHARRTLRRPAVNITPIERIGRILLGALGAVAGVVLLISAGSTLTTVLEALLVAAGLDLVITGALGHCPLYRKFGYVPPSLRSPT